MEVSFLYQWQDFLIEYLKCKQNFCLHIIMRYIALASETNHVCKKSVGFLNKWIDTPHPQAIAKTLMKWFQNLRSLCVSVSEVLEHGCYSKVSAMLLLISSESKFRLLFFHCLNAKILLYFGSKKGAFFATTFTFPLYRNDQRGVFTYYI